MRSIHREVNLLDSYPHIRRNISERARDASLQRAVARNFGREYFDGERTQGYGGYNYDGRWMSVAARMCSYFGLKPADRVLDVGCAKGFLLNDLELTVPGIRVFGLDISEYALENAIPSQRGRLVRGNARDLPFPSNSFDLVLSINTLHNLPRAECIRALAEIERVSRRHKYVQVDSWFNLEQRQNLERWVLTALTYYDPDGWRKLFAEAGYTGHYYWTITE